MSFPSPRPPRLHELTLQSKRFTRALNLRVTAVYGGAGVADQIADLKRGAEIVVCTPGRMIDILTMQAGKLVSLERVSFVVLDEADRMFDMGFEPQIKMIMQNIRPDRQTVRKADEGEEQKEWSGGRGNVAVFGGCLPRSHFLYK